MESAKQSSRFSRKLINLFAGMASGAPTLPRTLVEGGYIVQSLERTFTVDQGEKINPELILASSKAGHCLLLEAKSGANLNTDQLKRYALVTAESLRERAYVDKGAAKSHNILIIGLPEHKARLLQGSATHPSPARTIGLTLGLSFEEPSAAPAQSLLALVVHEEPRSGIELIENCLLPSALDNAFRPFLEVDWDAVPVNFLPVDHEAENWEFAERLVPALIARILAGEKTIEVAELGASVIDSWKLFSGTYKKQMTSRLEYVLKLAAQTRFSNCIKFAEKGTSKRKVNVGIPSSLANKPELLRSSLQRQYRRFLEDLKSPQIAIVFDPNAINQTDFFVQT